MVVTLTLNPAIDRTIKVPLLNQRDVTRVTSTRRDAAGKGINVSKVIASLQGDTVCTGFLAGDNGVFIQNQLDQLSIRTDFVQVSGETRENIKIQETDTNKVLEINELGPTISPSELQEITTKLDNLLQEGDVLVISGSMPKGINQDYYKTLLERYNAKGVTTLLDTSLHLLTRGIEGKPSIIKPNLYELEKLTGKTLSSNNDIIDEAKKLLQKGIKEVIVSMGKDGVLYISNNKVYKVTVPSVQVESTVGAGDSFVAGYSYALDNNFKLTKALRYAASVATASCKTEGTNPGSLEDITEIYKESTISEV